MMEQEQNQISEEKDRYSSYNPVTVTITEATGIVAMSIMAIILLMALLRAQARIRELQQMGDNGGS